VLDAARAQQALVNICDPTARPSEVSSDTFSFPFLLSGSEPKTARARRWCVLVRWRTILSSANAQAPSTSEGSGFASFDLDPKLTRGLEAAGFSEPRPIQVETIPACLDGQDVMGLAQTGTGKTAAFALPILQRLIEEPGRGPFVLILAPTRELAIQIDAEIRLLARFTDVKTMTIFGGIPANTQIRALRRDPEVIVGCPGRVLDLVKQRKLDLSAIDTLVLDEADHMFDMGFLPDIKRILAALPRDRQNLLFSATMPKAIRSLADSVLNRPHVVELAHSAPADRIEHALYATDPSRKRGLLEKVLSEDDCKTAIVFTRTKHRAKRMAIQLAQQGLNAVALQGNMSQAQRDRAMNGFRKGQFDILVATDIAARGLDVAGVDYVINFDPPSTPETYTHRIGRTGRSDASGKALTFVTSEDRAWVRDTERMLGEPIPRLETPDVKASPVSRSDGNGGGGRGGDRNSPSRGGRNGSGPGRGRRSSGGGSGEAKKSEGASRRSRTGGGRSRGSRAGSAPAAP
jgi:ATP-dependent RNA helicase RhlE